MDTQFGITCRLYLSKVHGVDTNFDDAVAIQPYNLVPVLDCIEPVIIIIE
jgi:hypothetical protein